MQLIRVSQTEFFRHLRLSSPLKGNTTLVAGKNSLVLINWFDYLRVAKKTKKYSVLSMVGSVNAYIKFDILHMQMTLYIVRNIRKFTKFLCPKGNEKFDDIYDLYE